MTDPIPHSTNTPTPKRPLYIEGVGWRYATEHRMTRWPKWKDSHKPGTYMVTLKVNGDQCLLGTIEGSTSAVYQWMKGHKEQVRMPQETFYDKQGHVIPADTRYARFHILNLIAKELCTEGIEHECEMRIPKA